MQHSDRMFRKIVNIMKFILKTLKMRFLKRVKKVNKAYQQKVIMIQSIIRMRNQRKRFFQLIKSSAVVKKFIRENRKKKYLQRLILIQKFVRRL